MDKIRFLLLLGLWGVLLPGCGKEGINEGPGQNGDIVFDIGFAPRTRVSTDADFKSAWEDGDEIGVYAVVHGGTLAQTANYIHNVRLTYNNGTWTQATPLYWPGSRVKLDFYAYYPYDEDTADPLEIAFDVKTDQGAVADYNASELLMVKSDNVDGWTQGSTVSLKLSHALSMVQLTLGGAVGVLDVNEEMTAMLRGVRTGCTLNLGTPEVTAVGEVSNITMYRVEQPEDAGYKTTFTFRALVPAQTLAEGSSLFRVINGNLILTGSDLASEVEMAAGRAEMFTREITHPDDGIVQPEANSYMVVPNSKAIYIPVSQANRVLTADGLGAETTGLGVVATDNYTVELVWGDQPVGAGGVLTEIGTRRYFDKDFVYVEPGVAGNAVVCIVVGGEIKWSWHIWVTEPVTSVTDTETGLTWMDRNLGAEGAGSWQSGGKNGLYYQWGRKDAFPASDGTLKKGSTSTYNNQIYYTPSNPGGTNADLPTSEYTTLPEMVKNPMNFAKNSTNYYGSLNMRNNNISWSGNSGEKTLYDPCPAGWKIPPSIPVGRAASWGSDSTSDWAVFADNGRIFNGVNGTSALAQFYPAGGYRLSGGKCAKVGSLGFYWSAKSSSTASQGRCMYFDNSGVYPVGNSGSNQGFTVRCVAE